MRRGGRINRGAHRAALHAAARPRPVDSTNRGAHRTPPPPSLAQAAALIREKARPAGKGPRGPGGGPRAAVPADLVAGDAGRRTGCARARFRGRREFRRCPWRAPDGARSAGWRGSMRMQGAGMPCSHGAGACGRNLDESETRLGCVCDAAGFPPGATATGCACCTAGRMACDPVCAPDRPCARLGESGQRRQADAAHPVRGGHDVPGMRNFTSRRSGGRGRRPAHRAFRAPAGEITRLWHAGRGMQGPILAAAGSHRL